MSHIQVRFNTKANGSPLVWRVVVDGNEILAEHVEIHGSCYSEESLVSGEKKYNIACHGTVEFVENKAVIKTT